jgi:hypothetical protein
MVAAKLDGLIVEFDEISYIIDDEVNDAKVFESDFNGDGFLLCHSSIHSLIN